MSRGNNETSRAADPLTSLIDATIRLVDEETEAIRRHGPREIERYAERKGQALVHLSRSLQPGSRHVSRRDALDRLDALRTALESNSRALQVHMDAVSEVSQLIVRSLEQASSDGTYAHPRGAGRPAGC